MRLLIPLLLLAACAEPRREAPNRWDDERLWPVLQAQEHRDARALCALLGHEAAEVREAAALAFASVQDTAGTPCLLQALRDDAAAVRATAAFALGFVADSLALERMAEAALDEGDSTAQRAHLSAAFIALQRAGRMQAPLAILHYLESATGHERARAADALRRLPDSTLSVMAGELLARMPGEAPDARQFLALALGRSRSQGMLPSLERHMGLDHDPGVRVNALRAMDMIAGSKLDTVVAAMTAIAPLGPTALALLNGRESVDARLCLQPIAQGMDERVRIGLLGLALRHGSERLADSLRKALWPLADADAHPYLRAAAIEALAARADAGTTAMLERVLREDGPAPVRQAAFTGLVRIAREAMARSRYASREAQFARLAAIVRAAINANDAGLACAAAELVLEEEPDAIRILLPGDLERQAIASLQPIRDLEGRSLLRQAAAKRDGLPPPAHERPPFNHPIDQEKLRALKQGQRYRISTSKGTIIIATDVNDCPGSSLAFDSLVTAGYYNGKAFHRMVPNFVVQGGCPRGDGYGGMPWTLRTEIGRKPFTAGSLGLASAGRDTESCQLFITHSATPHLDGRYTRFGEVVSGMEVVWRLQVGDVMERVERVE